MEQEVKPALPIVPTEAQKLYQEYLQKCCEVGQIMHQLTQLDSQKREIEKNLEVTERMVKSTAEKHKELQRLAALEAQKEVKQ